LVKGYLAVEAFKLKILKNLVFLWQSQIDASKEMFFMRLKFFLKDQRK
jgi:hypothetical protein